ncbi:MG2 domain-containing protein [Thermotoga sp. KOL6]|uniref:MG2 domain-containing protein n=1 Tax=Thermotoga sp. KOL6 TaxID=126741 RepID=UPI000C78CD46|nr:MG2 domain-containing protein [Thermotoga sp. KOL6]PLV59776.1 hypothetical protein AS005_00285 [Thermotoga sp. KOL6]
MRKWLFFLFIFTVANLFAGYAFFYGNPILRDGRIQFLISGQENVVLTIWRVENEEDFLKAVLDPENFDFRKFKRYGIAQRTVYSSRRGTKTFSFTLREPGLYFVTLSHFENRKEVLLDKALYIVTTLDIVYFSDGQKTVLYVLDVNNGFVKNAEVILFKNAEFVGRAFTGNDGKVILTEEFDSIYVKYGNERFFGEVNVFPVNYRDEKLFFITDRPIYKPSDIVHFRGQFFKNDGDVYRAIEETEVTVTIFDTKDNEVYKSQFKTDELGGFYGSVKLPETAPVGLYKVKVERDGREYSEYFLVEEYRKPEYKAEIETDKDVYLSNETINCRIKVKYFNDQPVVRAQVALYVYAFSESGENFLAYRKVDFTDNNGILNVGVKILDGFQGIYKIEVIAVDESQRQIEETKTVKVYADDVLILPSDQSFFAVPGKPVNITVRVTDLEGNPLNGNLNVTCEDSTSTVSVVNGKALVNFVPRESKTYRVKLSFGKAKTYIYIYAYHEANMSREFVILPEKKEVKPGDKLHVRFLAPGRVTGVLGIISSKIHETIPLTFNGSVELDLDIPEKLIEKNLFLVFIGYEDDFRVFRTEKLDAILSTNSTEMTLSFDKDQYEPGDLAQITIRSNVDKVCLFLVDEAIYALVGTEPPNLEDFLYPSLDYPQVYYDFVRTWRLYVSRNSFREQLAALPKEKKFADFKQRAFPTKLNVREYFPDTALWIPSLELQNGIAKVSFKVPDSITTFKATAYGFSRDQFAQAEGKMVVSKKFYVLPHLPSFLREGDVIQLSATVFNRTESELNVRLWVELPENLKFVEGKSVKDFVMKPNSSHIEVWTVKAITPSEDAKIKFVTTGDEWNDAVSMILPIEQFSFEREFYLLRFLNGKETIDLPKGSYLFSRIRFSDDIIPIIKDSIERLIEFPYGCVEQTMSSFFPAVAAANLGLKIEHLDEVVQKGLFRLYNYQHSDGGWGWWFFDESRDFMTCYVMEGLYFAKRAGYDVAESVIERGIDYLKKHLSAYGSYVLDLYGVEHKPYKPKSEIDLVFLSLNSKEALEQVVKFLVQDDQTAHLELKSEDPLISEAQLNSVLLRSLVKWKVYPQLREKLINYLLYKKDGYFWTSTKDTSFAILALLDALPRFDSISLKVKNNSNTFELKPGEEASLVPGSLTISGRGLVEIHVIHSEKPKSAVKKGIELSRRFYKRYELFLENEKKLVDVFVPLGKGYVPRSICTIEEKSTDELFILPFEYWGESFKYHGTQFEVTGSKLRMNGETYEFSKIKTLNGLILVCLKKEALLYDPKREVVSKYMNVKDADLTREGVVLLKDHSLVVNGVEVSIPEDVTALTCTKDEILLKGENEAYWYKDGKFVKLPFVARKIFLWNGRKLVAKGIRFSGCSYELAGSIFEIDFEVEEVGAKAGDILKTVIDLKGEGDYLIVEDFFPSCAQVIINYREKDLNDGKFTYGWYTRWNEWYSARELHRNRIAFFAIHASNGKFSYVWRATTNGKYQVLPARAYPMYSHDLYAHTDPDVLSIDSSYSVDDRSDQP